MSLKQSDKDKQLNTLRNELWSCSAGNNKRQTEIETKILNIEKLSQYEAVAQPKEA